MSFSEQQVELNNAYIGFEQLLAPKWIYSLCWGTIQAIGRRS
jgi:hypothetical protein